MPDSLEILTASTGGTYYAAGSAMAAQLESVFGIPVTAAPTSGSGKNVVLMNAGKSDLAFIAANNLYPAWKGHEPFKKKYQDLRLIAFLYPNRLIWYALQESGLRTISELKGNTVGVGSSALTWDHFISPIFEAHGISYETDITKRYAGFSSMARQVRDGLLDAALITCAANQPGAALQKIASGRDLAYLQWSRSAVQKLTNIPYFSPSSIPGDVIPGYQKDKYLSIDIGGPYLVANADMPNKVVYEITKALHRNMKAIADKVDFMKWAAEHPEELARGLADIPFHPGAKRYWKEVGIFGGNERNGG